MALWLAVSAFWLAAAPVGLAQEGDPAPDATAPNEADRIDLSNPEVRVVNEAELEKMRRFLERTQPDRGIVAQRTLPEGDRIDCVSIEAQPALRAYEMQGHELQRQPQTLPQDPSSRASGDRVDAERRDEPAAQQTVAGAPGAGEPTCPEGSVPYRRLTLEDLSRFHTLDEFLGKLPKGEPGLEEATPTPRSRSAPTAPMDPYAVEPPRDGATDFHQYAVMHHTVDNRGAEAVLNLWSPYAEADSEFSLSQIWVVRGSGSHRETVEAGWQKYRRLYGDYRARLFIYFTPDNYGNGGCYNLSCGKFVQTNNNVIIGGPYSSYSQLDGPQRTATLLWFKDGDNGHWWLRHGDVWVGYYPRELFDSNGLQTRAARVAFGGEILDTEGDGKHTATDMGSGRWPYEKFGKAAYQRTLRYVDTSNFYRDATGTAYSITDRWCYDLDKLSSGEPWREYFYFGGSGRNTECQ